MILGLPPQSSIPRYGKENKTFWKACIRVKIRVTVRPRILGLWVLGED